MYFFGAKQHCTHGSQCHYSHDPADKPTSASAATATTSMTGGRGGGGAPAVTIGAGGLRLPKPSNSLLKTVTLHHIYLYRLFYSVRLLIRLALTWSDLLCWCGQLLTSEIEHEHSLVLQAFRYLRLHNFLQQQPTPTPPAPAASQSTAQSNPAQQ